MKQDEKVVITNEEQRNEHDEMMDKDRLHPATSVTGGSSVAATRGLRKMAN
jgi:hypothetical protein